MTKLPENKCLLLVKDKKYEEAAKCYNDQVRINPRYTVGWYNRGVALTCVGGEKNKREAIKCFDEALKIRKDFPTAWYMKGSILADLGDKENKHEAVKCFDKAVELLFDHENFKTYEIPPSWDSKMLALYEKGITLFELYKDTREKYDEIISCLNEAQALSKDNSVASIILTAKGIIYYEMKDYKKAITSYKAAIDCYKDILQKNPNYAAPHIGKLENNMGLVFYKSREAENALHCYDRALSMLKDSEDPFEGSIPNFL